MPGERIKDCSIKFAYVAATKLQIQKKNNLYVGRFLVLLLAFGRRVSVGGDDGVAGVFFAGDVAGDVVG